MSAAKWKRKGKCPYCGHENTLLCDYEKYGTRSQLELCDPDDGGCDRQFVVDWSLIVAPTMRKIYGEAT